MAEKDSLSKRILAINNLLWPDLFTEVEVLGDATSGSIDDKATLHWRLDYAAQLLARASDNLQDAAKLLDLDDEELGERLANTVEKHKQECLAVIKAAVEAKKAGVPSDNAIVESIRKQYGGDPETIRAIYKMVKDDMRGKDGDKE